MIVVRFKVPCQPGEAKHVMALLKKAIGRRRKLDGVVRFDIRRDVANPDAFIVIEVSVDRAALDAHESLPEVAEALGLLEESPLAATVLDVSVVESDKE